MTRRNANAIVVSMVDLNRPMVCEKLFGSYTPSGRMRIDNWLTGITTMPVEIFWEIYLAFPYLDLARSMQDIYDRRLVRKAHTIVGKRAAVGEEVQKRLTTLHTYDMAAFITGGDHERIRQAADSAHPVAGDGPERCDGDCDPPAGD